MVKLKTNPKKTASVKVVNKVWFSLEYMWAIRLSEGAVYFKPRLWAGMQSKVNNNDTHSEHQ